jgi:hypothetical protein
MRKRLNYRVDLLKAAQSLDKMPAKRYKYYKKTIRQKGKKEIKKESEED